MGNTQNSEQYFINSSGITTNQSQTNTANIPVDVTTAVNTCTTDTSLTEQLVLYKYVDSLSNLEPSDECYETLCNFFCDSHLHDMVKEAKSSSEYETDTDFKLETDHIAAELQTRGVYNLNHTSDVDELSGRVSVTNNLSRMINVSSTQLTSLTEHSLGVGMTTKIKNQMMNSAPSLHRFLHETYDGLVQNQQNYFENNIVSAPGVAATAALANSGMLRNGGFLPPERGQFLPGRTLPSMYDYRSRLLRRGDIKSTLSDAFNTFKEILTGSESVNLNKEMNNHGEQVYTCPAAAVNAEIQSVSVKTAIGAIEKLLPSMMLAEYIKISAKVNLVACFGSAPNVANRPPDDKIKEMITLLPYDYIPAAAEIVRQAGAQFGLVVRSSEEDAPTSTSDVNILQMVVDKTPTSVTNGATVENVRLAKEQYKRLFPPGLHNIEALIALPNKVSLKDVSIPATGEKFWTEVVESISNCYSGFNIHPNLPYDGANPAVRWPETYADTWFGSPWGICTFSDLTSSSGLTSLNIRLFSSDCFRSAKSPYGYYVAVLMLSSNFKLRSMYADTYLITFRFTFSFWESPKSQGKAIPGLFLISDSIVDPTTKAPLDRIFIPATRVGNGALYEVSVSSENLSNAVANNLFHADGLFSVGVAYEYIPDANAYPKDMIYCISIVDGRATLRSKGLNPMLGNWIWNGVPCSDSLISRVFTGTIIDITTSHPADMSEYWRMSIAPLFSSYISDIIALLYDPNNILSIVGIQAQLQECAVTPKDFIPLDATRDWLRDVISELPSWLLWRSTSAWLKIHTESIPKMAWCVISLMRAYVMLTIYTSSNSSTLTSCMEEMNKMFDDSPGTPAVSSSSSTLYSSIKHRSESMRTALSLVERGHTRSSRTVALELDC